MTGAAGPGGPFPPITPGAPNEDAPKPDDRPAPENPALNPALPKAKLLPKPAPEKLGAYPDPPRLLPPKLAPVIPAEPWLMLPIDEWE